MPADRFFQVFEFTGRLDLDQFEALSYQGGKLALICAMDLFVLERHGFASEYTMGSSVPVSKFSTTAVMASTRSS